MSSQALHATCPRTIDHAVADGTFPAVDVGPSVLTPHRPFFDAFGAGDPEASALPGAEEQVGTPARFLGQELSHERPPA